MLSDLSSRISLPYLPVVNSASGTFQCRCCAPAPGVGWKRVALPPPQLPCTVIAEALGLEKTAEHRWFNKASKDRTETTHLVLIYFHLADPGF